MALPSAPPDIERIFDRPGGSWSAEQFQSVIDWLMPEHYGLLHLHAAWHLGTGTSREDVEDVLSDFFLRALGHQGGPGTVVRTYDPDKGSRFQGYLLLCLKRECWKRGATLRKAKSQSQPIADIDSDGNQVDREVPDPAENPEERLQRVDQRAFVERCIEMLAPKYRETLTLIYVNGQSLEEVAQALNVTYGTAKVRLFRARQMLRGLMNEHERSGALVTEPRD